MNLRLRPLTAALLMAACGTFPAFVLADDSSRTMTPAELAALRQAYAAGYQAAHADGAQARSGGGGPGASAAGPAPNVAPPRTMVDLKESYSDAGDVETVQQIPISALPLPDGPVAPATAVARPPAKAAEASMQAAPRARAPTRAQLVAEFCAATSAQPAARSEAQHPSATTIAGSDQIPDDSNADDDAPVVTPQQFEADAQEYARQLSQRESAQRAASPEATPAIRTAYSSTPSHAVAPAPQRFWSAQYHTWVTVDNTAD